MMLRRYGGLSLLALACAAGSYLATYALQSSDMTATAAAATPPSLVNWLNLTDQQAVDVEDIERHFAEDQAILAARLATEREILAAMFESPTATDAEFLAQVEKVIEAHDTLERRIAKHLVELRPHLSSEQQRRLFNCFANSMREGNRRGWRFGQTDETPDERRGGGPPSGRGRGGPPDGRGRRGGRPAPTSQPQPDQP